MMARHSRLPLYCAFALLLLTGGALLRMGHTLVASAQTPTPAAVGTVEPQNKPAPSTNAPPMAPPGTIAYQVKKGEILPMIVHRYLADSTYMTGAEFEAALRTANGGRKGNNLKPGEWLIIPGMEGPITEKPIPVPKAYEVRAIYLTGATAGSAHGLDVIRHWREVGGNAVVFDAKDSDGIVNVSFRHPLVPANHTPYIRNLPKLARFLHRQGMHAIARIAIFRDEYLAQNHSALAVQSRRNKAAWRENGKLVWVDPSRADVQSYNIQLAKFVAESGVDEIQFDYVRFPAEGDQKDAQFAFETAHPKWTRADVISDFLKTAYGELRPLNVLFSLDVFGVMAWQRNVDLAHTGQDIVQMAPHCDVLSPMIYPSHFFGMDGYAWPGDAPEHFISASMDRFVKITAGSGVVLRPWLQAFGWKTKTYSPEYIRTQVSVAKQNGGIGFLFWNARNDYGKPFVAMPEMRATPGRYFRGDELPAQGGGETNKAAGSQ